MTNHFKFMLSTVLVLAAAMLASELNIIYNIATNEPESAVVKTQEKTEAATVKNAHRVRVKRRIKRKVKKHVRVKRKVKKHMRVKRRIKRKVKKHVRVKRRIKYGCSPLCKRRNKRVIKAIRRSKTQRRFNNIVPSML